jgi:NADH/NAD ratio-sensing transcriptional regulator Rex
MMQPRGIADETVKCLPNYLPKLMWLSSQGLERVSSRVLAEELGLNPSVIRKDTLVENGIMGILNFSSQHIIVPAHVKVISIDMVADLACLPYYVPVVGETIEHRSTKQKSLIRV